MGILVAACESSGVGVISTGCDGRCGRALLKIWRAWDLSIELYLLLVLCRTSTTSCCIVGENSSSTDLDSSVY